MILSLESRNSHLPTRIGCVSVKMTSNHSQLLLGRFSKDFIERRSVNIAHDIVLTDLHIPEDNYQKALNLLSTLPSSKTLQKAAAESTRPKSLLASLFPNHEGPIATAIRILAKIEQELSFLPLRIFKSLNFKRPHPNVREKASARLREPCHYWKKRAQKDISRLCIPLESPLS